MTATIAQPFTFSKHALQRMSEMALGPEDAHLVRDAMTNPRAVREAGPGKEYRTRGRITLVVTTDEVPVVVSVLWARMSDWAEDENTIQSRGLASADQHRRTRHQIRSRKAHNHHSRRG